MNRVKSSTSIINIHNDHPVSPIQPKNNVEIVYDIDVEDNEKESTRCGSYDFNKIYSIIGFICLSVLLVACSEITKKYIFNFQLGELFLWEWLLIMSFFPIFYVCGNILDGIIFFIIDAIGIFENYTTIFIYYMSSFRNIIGHVIIIILFSGYYPTITDFQKTNLMDKILLVLIVIGILLCCRNLAVNFVMRKRLITIFKNNINLIILYKSIVHDLTFNMNTFYNSEFKIDKSEKDSFSRKKIASWKLIKVKNTGFNIWENGQKHQIFKKKRIQQIINNLWHYLLDKYIKTNDLQQQFKYTTTQDNTVHICRIPSEFLMKEIEINEGEDYYFNIYQLFDPENDTFISEHDFKNAILQMFQKWKESNTFLVGYNNLSTVLKYVMSFITSFIALIIILNIFDIPISSVFVPFATITVTISFSISRVLSNIAANIVFVIFMEPYTIGQRVNIREIADGNNLIVKDIKILTTLFRETKSGKIYSVPNHELYNFSIVNHHSSQMVIFNINLKIKCNTSHDKLDILTECVNEYLRHHPNEWKPHTDLYFDTIEHDKNYISVMYWVQHYSFWGDSLIYASRTELLKFIISKMNELNIEFETATMPVKMKQE